MSKRKAAGLVAGLAVTAATVAAGVAAATPAGAAQTTSFGSEFHLAGDFYDDGPEARDELFIYVRGLAPDALLTFARNAGPGSQVNKTSHPFQVNGNYTPVAGDFDGDGWDEILWYGPGAGADYLWDFDGTLTPTSTPVTVNGTYEPFSGDFTGDGADDVFWYGVGTAPDYMWEYDVGGTRRTAPMTVNGTYRVLPGSFGQNQTDDLFFYAAGPAADYLWDFTPNSLNHTSLAIPVGGSFFPFVLDIFADGWRGNDIFWYGPGTSPDLIWDFLQGTRQTLPITVNGSYLPIAGDFLGDGHSDIIWSNASGYGLWDYYPDGSGGVVRYDYSFFISAASSASARTAGGAAEGTSESSDSRQGRAIDR